ncbi:hypothetical protein BZA05DRAFT_473900 [Tricharina praecox]|uniref:uncharacterized protein n=1 Tax=Tricharina praecox TaxID=43433 RepID=UPI002220F892|nr:uncharacterized protein BZA05DRAFT_473900 [Tricharina praecox]KAI5852365.1 hypothetical protein BZA05DRAFT_473900 [Tricharina praecox]
MPKVVWTPENDRKLLIRLIERSAKAYDTVELAKLFAGATPKAIEERIAKLKREAKAADGGSGSGNGGGGGGGNGVGVGGGGGGGGGNTGSDTAADYSASPSTFPSGRKIAGMKRKRTDGGGSRAARKKKDKLISVDEEDDEETKCDITSMGMLKIEDGTLATADQKLLLAILSVHKVTIDYASVSAIVGCTPRACEERLKKLRKLSGTGSPAAKRQVVVKDEEDPRRRVAKTEFSMARTREGVEIPLGVPLEISQMPVVNGWFEEEILDQERLCGIWDE